MRRQMMHIQGLMSSGQPIDFMRAMRPGAARSICSTLLTVVLCAVAIRPSDLRAQVIRGTVVDVANRPVVGAVVVLIDSTDAVLAQSLSNDRGEYRVATSRAGSYRLRTMRIGFVPTLSAPYVLTPGGVTEQQLVLTGARVALDAVHVVAQGTCGKHTPADATAIFAAWDQAMTSIAATTLSSTRGLSATTMLIDRTLEPNGRKIKSQSASVRTAVVTQPWRSLAPTTLRQRGYTETDVGGTTFYAPGLDVLVSPQFLEDHCIRLVNATDTSEIGVAFQPTDARRRKSEIRGTLWLTRATADLRRLDFAFTETPTAVKDYAAGGQMTFTRLADGSIVIASWEIRMPMLMKETPRSPTIRLDGILSTGGQVVVLKRGADTLFKRQPVVLAGIVLDSVSGRSVGQASVSLVGTTLRAVTDANGGFTMADVLPGAYALAVRTPSLDSVRTSSQSEVIVADGMPAIRVRVPTASQLARSLCGSMLDGAAGRGRGALLGTINDLAARDGIDTTAFGNVRVVADWTESAMESGRVRQQSKRLETRTDASGAFRLCGVPTEALLTVRALPDRGRATALTARLAADERFATVALRVDRTRTAVSTFVGVVVADSSNRVLADAEVGIPSLALTTRTDVAGTFRLTDVPVGTHEIYARRVGYGAMTASLTFSANDYEERRIVLRPLTVLDSVEVVASRTDIAMLDFDANRRVGLGHFFGREQLQRREGQTLAAVLLDMPSLGLVRGRTSGAYVQSSRFVVPLSAQAGQESSTIWKPSDTEKLQGMKAGCYAQVYVDGQLMNPSQPTEPFDVSAMAASQIEAVEYYASAAETPSRYAKLNSNCGVLVVHRRRS